MWAKLKATFGVARTEAQAYYKRMVTNQAKATSVAQLAITAAAQWKPKLTEIENFVKLVAKWRVKAQADLLKNK